MPLTDVVRYLNARDRETRPFAHLDDPYHAVEHGAIVRYARIALSSSYAPVRSSQSDHVYGHVAVLNAHGELNNILLHPEAIFAIPSTNEEFIHLDRLVRTLHAVNYLVHHDPRHLFVKVNLRHIESVPSGHGEVFENALRSCNLEPTGITLLVNIVDDPTPELRAAIASYRERGYQIALSRHGHAWKSLGWLKALKPDLVNLDAALLQTPERLGRLVSRLHGEGWRTLIEVDGSPSQILRANEAHIDLLQYPVTHQYEHNRLQPLTASGPRLVEPPRVAREEATWIGV